SYLVLTVPYVVALTALFALSYRARPKIITETLASMQKLLSADKNTEPGSKHPS
ncbi:MAG: ABC transporter permease, partial [Mesorhizobium sp.]